MEKQGKKSLSSLQKTVKENSMRRLQKPFAQVLPGLVAWFERHQRVLPWREDPSPYRVWVSEVMLQQTQVATVVPYFERWMERFPAVTDLANASLETVLGLWSGLGYYSRARSLHEAAKLLKNLAPGDWPCTREEWLKLPGVGPYTAGAVLSIAWNLPEALLDGNVERVFARVFGISRSRLGERLYSRRLWALARALLHRATQRYGLAPRALNQAWMELGATLCVPKGIPLCQACPLQKACHAFRTNSQGLYPEKKPKPLPVVQTEHRHWIVHSPTGSFLMEQSQPGEWRAGLWDFPTQIPSSFGVKKYPLPIQKTHHVVTHHRITRFTHFWQVKEALGNPQVLLPVLPSTAFRWVSPNAWRTLPMGAAARKSIEQWEAEKGAKRSVPTTKSSENSPRRKNHQLLDREPSLREARLLSNPGRNKSKGLRNVLPHLDGH